MSSFEKPITFSWIPKGGGKGGQFSNATSHDADTDMLSQVNQLLVTGGHWFGKSADLFIAGIGSVGGRFPCSLHIFNSFSQSLQNFNSFLMFSHYEPLYLGLNLRYRIGRAYLTSTYTVNYLEQELPSFPILPSPVVYETVKNKCYASGGYGPIQVGSDAIGPRVYYDATGAGTALIGVNWGLPTPLPNLQVTPDPASYQTGTCTTNGTATVTAMSFDPTVNLAQGMPFYIESAAGSGQYYEYIIQSTTATTVTLTTAVVPNYAGAKCQGNYGSLTWGQSQPNILSGTGTTNGSNTISATTFDPTASVKPGYRVLVETSTGSQVWNTYIIASVTSNSIVITGVTVESYVGARIRVDLPATSSGISSDSSYQYAISYYDSARGHIGNPGPIYTVNWGPPFNKRINLLVQNITDAPLQTGVGKRYANWTYDKIILWRTAANGATLQSRVLLNPAGGGGSQNFSDNMSDDTQLGQVGPVGAGISSKLTAHGPPPDDLNFATYWEGRFFGASTSNPGILYWTAAAGQEIDFYGVPEECWPPLNTLPIPESDGTITGIRTVGAALIVMTQNNLYQVAYNTSNTTSIFRLNRLSAKGSGTSHFATARLPGEDAQTGDILVHFGNDKRLYMLYGAGADLPISYPIQDQLNTITNPSQVRVGVRHDANATYIVLQPNQGNAASGTSFQRPPHSVPAVSSSLPTFLYDLDRKVWLPVVGPQSCYEEGLFNGATTAFMGGSPFQTVSSWSGNFYIMSGATTIESNGNGGSFTIRTQWVNVPGLPRMNDKDLQAVLIWADNIDPANAFVLANAFTVFGETDEGSGPSCNFQLVAYGSQDPLSPVIRAYADTPNCYVYVPTTQSPLRGRTFRITATQTPGTLAPNVYEMMAMWSSTTDDASTGGVL